MKKGQVKLRKRSELRTYRNTQRRAQTYFAAKSDDDHITIALILLHVILEVLIVFVYQCGKTETLVRPIDA